MTLSGAANASTNVNINAEGNPQNIAVSGQVQHNVGGGKLIVTLQWVPSNGSWATDPAPAAVIFGAGAVTSATAIASVESTKSSSSASASASVSVEDHSASASASCTGPDGDDSQTNNTPMIGLSMKLAYVNQGGMAQFQVPLTWSLSGSVAGVSGSLHSGQASCTFGYTVQVLPLADWFFGAAPVFGAPTGNIHGPGLNPFSGLATGGASDPTFTRWLPLEFSPHVSSRPPRTASGALQQPWGNMACAYSISLGKDTSYDVPGYGLVIGTNGVPVGNTGQLAPQYSIYDAAGNKLVFFANFAPNRDIKGTFTTLNTGQYQLSNAGPPSNMAARGLYTYTFDVMSSGVARLLSISDPLGNTHTCTYPGSSNFLTVSDSSSGKSVQFYKGTNGYLGDVIAPASNGATYVDTKISTDSTGHMTGVNVFPGGGTVASSSDIFTYTGDTLTLINSNGSLTAYGYTNDKYKDATGNTAQSASSMKLGAQSDTTSSDDGGTVLGTFSYSYNWIGSSSLVPGGGYSLTLTDPLSRIFKTNFALSNGGAGALSSLVFTDPSYVGAPANSNVWNVTYSPDILSPTSWSEKTPLGKTWSATFDSFGNITSMTDPLNEAWSATYTSDGIGLKTFTDETNLTWTVNYGENGAPSFIPTSLVDPSGVQRFNVSANSFGQVSQVTVPSGTSASGTNEVTSFAYDPVTGSTTSITNPLGEVLAMTGYDPLGDLLSSAVYPDTGNPATSTQALTTSGTYNASQMPVTVTGPSGLVTSLGYGVNDLTSITLQRSGTTLAFLNMARDSRGRLYAATDGAGSLGGFRYDRDDNLTKVIDGRGNTTTLSYGANGEAIGVQWPDGNSTSLGYDVGGRITSKTNERGQVVTYGYDEADQLTSEGDATYTYDAVGRLLIASNANGSTAVTLDSLKRVQYVDTTVASHTYRIGYTYYPDGKVSTMTSPAGATTYVYDAAGRLRTMTDPYGNTTTWTRDHAGRVTGQSTTTTASHTISTTYAWGNGANAPVTTIANVTESVDGSSRYVYQNSITSLDQLGGWSLTASNGNNEVRAYTYDARGRLTKAIGGNTAFPTAFTSNYTYDLANNLRGLAGAGGGWTYDSRNRVTAAPSISDIDAAGLSGITYDASGNLLTGNGLTLTYDSFGHLTSASGTPVGLVSFTYDHTGRRLTKTSNGITTVYLYDQGTLVAEINASTGAVVRSYQWGELGVISDCQSTGARFYLYEQISPNVHALLDSSGNLLGEVSYTAYGTPFQMGSNGLPAAGAFTPTTPLAWGARYGCYRDNETGLVLMGERFYAPAIGRFVSADPCGFLGGINSIYGYCGGDPVDFIDPCGLDGIENLSGFVDNTLFSGEAGKFGESLGKYETGKGGLGPVIGHGLLTAGMLVANAIGIGEAAEGAQVAVRGAEGALTAARGAEQGGQVAFSKVAKGPFSFRDWTGYPEGLPRPSGPFEMREGAEYTEARAATNAENRMLREGFSEQVQGKEIHEVHPVKFGGSPTAPENKILLDPKTHKELTDWWFKVMQRLK